MYAATYTELRAIQADASRNKDYGLAALCIRAIDGDWPSSFRAAGHLGSYHGPACLDGYAYITRIGWDEARLSPKIRKQLTGDKLLAMVVDTLEALSVAYSSEEVDQ